MLYWNTTFCPVSVYFHSKTAILVDLYSFIGHFQRQSARHLALFAFSPTERCSIFHIAVCFCVFFLHYTLLLFTNHNYNYSLLVLLFTINVCCLLLSGHPFRKYFATFPPLKSEDDSVRTYSSFIHFWNGWISKWERCKISMTDNDQSDS